MERVEGNVPKEQLFLNIRSLNPRILSVLQQREKIRDLVLFSISQKIAHSLNLRDHRGFHLCIASGHND
jgi:hypothetical protein